MNFGGSGALVLRRFSFKLMVRPFTPAAAATQIVLKYPWFLLPMACNLPCLFLIYEEEKVFLPAVVHFQRFTASNGVIHRFC